MRGLPKRHRSSLRITDRVALMGMKSTNTHIRSCKKRPPKCVMATFCRYYPAGYFLLLWRDNRIKNPTLSYPHGIGGYAASRVTRIIPVDQSATADIAKVGSVRNNNRKYPYFYFLNVFSSALLDFLQPFKSLISKSIFST